MALSEKIQSLLKSSGLVPGEIRESFCRSSGPGGQNVNKVSTSVQLLHVPSGIQVMAQDFRSQSANRELAYQRLVEALLASRERAKREKIAAKEKVRRQNRQRPRRLKRRILENKRIRGNLKVLRRRPAE